VALIDGLSEGEVATLVAPGEGDPANPARVKVEVGESGLATSFTRRWTGPARPWWVHVGVYGFAPGVLARCVAAPDPASGEDLEQLAWIATGIPIRAIPVDHVAQSVDTPADLASVRDRLRRAPEEP
jgi:CMP-2-keto-3-deoxyoctulosonic acid synthetase